MRLYARGSKGRTLGGFSRLLTPGSKGEQHPWSGSKGTKALVVGGDETPLRFPKGSNGSLVGCMGWNPCAGDATGRAAAPCQASQTVKVLAARGVTAHGLQTPE